MYSTFTLRRTLHHLKSFVRLEPRDWGGYFLGRVKIVWKMAARLVGVGAGWDGGPPATEAKSVKGRDPAGSGEWVEVLDRVEEAGRVADRNFVPKPYDGHLLIIRPVTRDDDPYRDEALGWRPLANGGVTAYEVEGDHLGILRQPQVQKLADLLARYISDADQHRAEKSGEAVMSEAK